MVNIVGKYEVMHIGTEYQNIKHTGGDWKEKSSWNCSIQLDENITLCVNSKKGNLFVGSYLERKYTLNSQYITCCKDLWCDIIWKSVYCSGGFQTQKLFYLCTYLLHLCFAFLPNEYLKWLESSFPCYPHNNPLQ